jgi:hypothetical protein
MRVKNRQPRRGVFSRVAVLMAMTLVLSGCVPEPEIYARSGTEGLAFRVCGPGVLESLEVEVIPRSAPVSDGYATAWSVVGEVDVTSSIDIVYGVVPTGGVVYSPAEALLLEEQNLLVTAVISRPDGAGPRQMSASFLAANPLDGLWRNQAGAAVEGPCG